MRSRFRLLDVARMVVDDLNALLDKEGRSLIYTNQMREAGGSITFNIREGYGRRDGPDRKQFFRIARGSAEEVDEQLRTNFARGRISATQYWRLHHRLAVIVKMLNSLLND